MKIPALFKEYIWLVNTIYKVRRISLSEINDKWVETEMSGGIPFARTTFNRHKDAIQDIFGIYIDCDRKNGYKYYIGNAHVLREDSIQNWMLTTISVSNMITESLPLQHRILLESIPTDGVFLKVVLDAMKQNRLLSIHYRRYQSQQAKTYTIAPYCIKLFHRRWYLLVKYKYGNFGILSFDRILDIESLPDKFEFDKDFDALSFFNDCFGVVIGDGTAPERIVLRAYGNEQYALRDLPLHQSQKELGNTTEYTDFEYYMKPTDDFKAYMLSRGQWLQVIYPESLSKEICNWLQTALRRYKIK
ncbi:MAG: WYL domain-containing protein [Bacteroidaceae bacterium]|nr:WYL domain-containing protein [Bacteroidaceae bacterium]